MLETALAAHAGPTLDAIKSKGVLRCGVNTGLAGFSAADSQGNWSGLDVDTCRAIAAAVLATAIRRDTSFQAAATLQGDLGQIILIPVPGASWTVPKETRAVVVRAEVRAHVVPSESRSLTVRSDPRAWVVPTEDRSA